MYYSSKIKGVRETDDGTDVIIHIPNQFIQHKILKYKRSAAIDAELIIDDKRRITSEQREKIWATINDIANYQGWWNSTELKEILVEEFCKERELDIFSLSRRKENAASIRVARDFITYILDFAIVWEIPLLELAITRTQDADRMMYKCLATRTCVITGKKNADIHHVTGSRVGMGRNRKKISHSGLELIALSREWHNKVHQEGEYETFKKYQIYGITLKDETLQHLGIKNDEIW